MKTGTEIKSYIELKRINKTALAERLNISRTTLYDWLNKNEHLEIILEALDIKSNKQNEDYVIHKALSNMDDVNTSLIKEAFASGEPILMRTALSLILQLIETEKLKNNENYSNSLLSKVAETKEKYNDNKSKD